jgi:hypothetical protein
MIVEVVEVEGPCHEDLILRRVREAWRVSRSGSRIRSAYDSAIKVAARRGQLKRVESLFLAQDEDQLSAVRIPGDNAAARRKVEEVPRAELKLAVRHLISDARRVTRDELTFQVARLFGWNRRGPDIAAALDGAVDELIREGVVAEDNGYLKST